MTRLKDMTNYKFNGCVVLKRAENKGKNVCWLCRCYCGVEFVVRATDIRTGNTKSCGCLNRKLAGDRARKHGNRNSRLYNIWNNMKMRCSNPNSVNFKNYGARGISVCDEWFNSFENFYKWAMGNGYNDTLTLDRIDNDKGYKPSNCKWADYTHQERNRRNNHILEYNNEKYSIAEWSDITGIPYSTLWSRIKKGWSVEKALTQPLRGQKELIWTREKGLVE
ncbi:hypothetical protein [Staphylococcus phage vB_SsapH-Golestan101-M]|uniref:hypothetical protein n=1 Tax=Staphylococcus sp. GDY8P79P TaxID=2804427 RepID=UPI00159918EB|nr:hypothetical protein [Staphylococcus sp. GDY8P79P]BCG66439.1 hypothetical protein [Staphylococcus phage vB_SsapH-Golestan101-M]